MSDDIAYMEKYLRQVQTTAAKRERAAIVAWLRRCAQLYAEIHDVPVVETAADLYATLIERGEHLDGLREGGGATRPSLGNRPPQPGSGT